MASTWGNNTWGSNAWADDVILTSVTGQQLTSNVGSTLEAFNEEGWGRLNYGVADWGEGADETVSVTGLEATASAGSITTGITVFLEMIGSNHSLTSELPKDVVADTPVNETVMTLSCHSFDPQVLVPQVEAIRKSSLRYTNDCVTCVCCWKLNCKCSRRNCFVTTKCDNSDSLIRFIVIIN